nr:uncharacterized protein LOC106689063 [Halyomorpha halys]
MEPSLRYDEFTNHTRELRGILILCGFIFSIVCGILWHFPIKVPSATISATLISISLSSINQILGEKAMSLCSILVFSLSLVFYCIKNIKIPISDKINSDGFYVTLKQFSVLLSSIIIAIISNNAENKNNKALDWAITSFQWYSFSLPFKDFVLPKLSTKSLVLLPVFCSQFIASYCCFRALSKEKEKYLKGLLLETIFIVVVAAFGVIVPLTIDPTSIGLLQMTKVKHTEPSVISGGLLILFSIMVKMVALLSYISYSVLCGISLFLYGQLLQKGLEEMNSDERESSIIAMSVLFGLVVSSASVEIERNILYSIAVLIIKSPVLITFVTSVLLSVVLKGINKK